jgi:hypothetical protein
MHLSKAHSAAALECCKIGMRLAEFATPAIYNDWWSVFTWSGLSRWIFFGATYNNGDNTDSWCSNFAIIPNNIITNKFDAYENCQYEFNTQRLVVNEVKNSYLVMPENAGGINMFSCMP